MHPCASGDIKIGGYGMPQKKYNKLPSKVFGNIQVPPEHFIIKEFKLILVLLKIFGINVWNDFKKQNSVSQEIRSKRNPPAILKCMIGLFWDGYRMAFTHNLNMLSTYFGLLTCSALFNSFHNLLMMISASLTNEAADRVKGIVECLPYRILTQHRDIKYRLKKNCDRHNRLTIWSIYVLDRSLIITCFGTLLTYGILIGTLGKPA
ncbi:uncharacterized protein NPIL_428361 [Nephila pilipes]|uniref:Uncharacterized protein n=1 Tax=Nephila pilipes TaxID=299642 RepID=A0A8X6JIE2_NEPPI|nr:uncharacterized protein NPIL_428361 [Nephila pilipes]